jgi:hypothetical protein
VADEIAHFCSLDDEQLAARRAEWRDVARGGLVETETRTDGFTSVYRGDDSTARALVDLVAAERVCCPDIEWRIERDGDLIRLHVTYPASV